MRPPEVTLKLAARDRKLLAAMERGKLSNRRWLRIRALRLLDKGRCVQDVAEGLGTYPRVIRRVRNEYEARGLEAALNDRPRPNRRRQKLDDAQKAKIVSIACSAPPPGYAKWTLELLAEEGMRRGIAPKLTRHDTQKVMKTHDLKPWREKNVVRTEIRRRVRGPDRRRVELVLGTVEEERAPGLSR